MTRPTPERLAEIRRYCTRVGAFPTEVGELLAEIDALMAEQIVCARQELALTARIAELEGK